MPIDSEIVSASLQPTRAGLDAEGFDLTRIDLGGKVQLKVSARQDACEDCLVPKSLFLQMARDEVQEAGLQVLEMEVLYPIDTRRA